jgi:cytochrome c biogenesis protein CcdA
VLEFFLLIVVALLPFAVALYTLRGVRPSDEDRRLRRWRIQRRQWLAVARFLLTFAGGSSLVLILTGEIVKYLILIIPALLAAALFGHLARRTPE